IVVCLPILKKQAREHCHSEKLELKILLTHGVLHLLGMDHEKSAKSRALMKSYENQVLKGILGSNRRASGLILRSYSGKKTG
ncbi:MAG: rRNA maturation RNase YbeY, partial [Bdellovibrionota bacterium]